MGNREILDNLSQVIVEGNREEYIRLYDEMIEELTQMGIAFK